MMRTFYDMACFQSNTDNMFSQADRMPSDEKSAAVFYSEWLEIKDLILGRGV